MKRINLLVSLFAALGCLALEAQTTILTANIPFNFQVGKDEMPAGAYRIDYTHGLLSVRRPDGDKCVFVLTVPKSRDKAPETGILEFHRYGDTYFLSGVWTPGSADGAGLVKTSREKELASRLGSPQPAAVALNTHR